MHHGIPSRIQVIDSHTAGEPTRVVIAGGPDLGGGDMKDRLAVLRSRHDSFRTAVLAEPRGSEVLVGALLCPPVDDSADIAVIFFNDVGYLGMCGHGTIGVVTTLAYLGRIGLGNLRIQTPVGTVAATLHADGTVSFKNIRSYRHRSGVALDVSGYASIRGDIAWGGNWFFLTSGHGLSLRAENRGALMEYSIALREALVTAGITGADGAAIDHIELTGPAADAENSGRNFVLCPGAAFDRSPCGTGTSAKLACLHADGKLAFGEAWRQEGILGTVFEGSIEPVAGGVIPTIRGHAFVTAESTLVYQEHDPFLAGILF